MIEAEFTEWICSDGEHELHFYNKENGDWLFGANPKYVSKDLVDKLVMDIDISEANIRKKKS